MPIYAQVAVLDATYAILLAEAPRKQRVSTPPSPPATSSGITVHAVEPGAKRPRRPAP